MDPIPGFPRFRRLALTDWRAIDRLTGAFPPYSDFDFMSLWSWSFDGGCEISLLNDNFVVRLKDYVTDDVFYSFIGTGAVLETARTLIAHARQQGLLPYLKLVPGSVIAAEPRLSQELAVTDDRDNWDYILSLTAWDTLAGRRYRRHRRLVARCDRQTAPAFRVLDPSDQVTQRAMIELFHCWASQKPAGEEDARHHELAGLQRLFHLAGDGRLGACGVYDGHRLIGFSLWEALPGRRVAITHVRKSDRSYDGVTTYLRHHESRVLLSRGYRYMNIEQDLGIPGLRDAKLSLRPYRLLRKYAISE